MRNSSQLVISQVIKCRGKILITRDMRGPEGILSFKVHSNIQISPKDLRGKYSGANIKIFPFQFQQCSISLQIFPNDPIYKRNSPEIVILDGGIFPPV